MSINVWHLSNCSFSIPLFFFRELRVIWWDDSPCSDAVPWLGGPATLEKSEIHLKNLLFPTPQPSRQMYRYIKERYTYDNAFPWWWGITEDAVTVKKQAAVKMASALTTLRGLDFTTLKTIQLTPRCGIDRFFCTQQLTLPQTSRKCPIFLLVTDTVTHIVEWDSLIRICAYFLLVDYPGKLLFR